MSGNPQVYADRIGAAIVASGHDPADLADVLGVSPRRAADLLAGRAWFDLGHVVAIASWCGVALPELVADTTAR